MENEITSPKDLVAKLGGPTKAAAVFGEKYPSTVSNWVRANALPAAKYRKHKAILSGLGIDTVDSLWFSMENA